MGIFIRDVHVWDYISWQVEEENGCLSQDSIAKIQELVIDRDGLEKDESWLEDLMLLTNIQSITIRYDVIRDHYFDCFEKLKSLRSVTFDNCVINSPNRFSECRLNDLGFWNCDISDFSFLSSMTELQSLTVVNDALDISFISHIKKLTYLNLSSSRVINAGALGSSVERLYINDTNIKDLGFIAAFHNLKLLSIDEAQYDDNKEVIQVLMDRGIEVLLDGMESLKYILDCENEEKIT